MKQILTKPVITEKSMGKTPDGKYSFKVAKGANKVEIAREVEKMYKVSVDKVNIINTKGKMRRYRGKFHGMTSGHKKAIVTLKKGQKIKEFDVKEQ